MISVSGALTDRVPKPDHAAYDGRSLQVLKLKLAARSICCSHCLHYYRLHVLGLCMAWDLVSDWTDWELQTDTVTGWPGPAWLGLPQGTATSATTTCCSKI